MDDKLFKELFKESGAVGAFRKTPMPYAKKFMKLKHYEALVKLMTDFLEEVGLDRMTEEERRFLKDGYTLLIARKKALLLVLEFMEKKADVKYEDIVFIEETKATFTDDIRLLSERFQAVFNADPVCAEVVTKEEGLQNLEALERVLRIQSKESLALLFPTPSEMNWVTSPDTVDYITSEDESDSLSDVSEATLTGIDESTGLPDNLFILSEEQRIVKWNNYLITEQGQKIFSEICSTMRDVQKAAASFKFETLSEFKDALNSLPDLSDVTVEETEKLIELAKEAKLGGTDILPDNLKDAAVLKGYHDSYQYPLNVAQGKRILQLFERVEEATAGVVKGPTIKDISSDGCEDTLPDFDISAGVLADFTSCSVEEQMKKWRAFLFTDQGMEIYSRICSTRRAVQEAAAGFKFGTLSEFQDALNLLPELSDVTGEEAMKLIEAAKKAEVAADAKWSRLDDVWEKFVKKAKLRVPDTNSRWLQAEWDNALEEANLGRRLSNKQCVFSIRDFRAEAVLQSYRDVEQYPVNVTEGKRLLQLLKRVKEATSKGNQT